MNRAAFFAFFILQACLTSIATPQEYSEVTVNEDPLLVRHEQSEKRFIRLEIGDLISFFHQRIEDGVTVEGDFIRYKFDRHKLELMDRTEKWRMDLPLHLPPSVSQIAAENQVVGDILSAKLYFISPESAVYPLEPTPKNPCWIIWSETPGELSISIIDAMTSEFLGNGIPPPASGFSMSGPQHSECSDPWYNWYNVARNWFEQMDYPTTAMEFPTSGDIQSQIQSNSTAMFYEIAHGGSYSFQNYCPGYTTASEVGSWMDEFASVPFAFIASCDGMCDLSENHFSYEFRKGRFIDAVTVGYCGMSTDPCNTAWEQSLYWQGHLFMQMNFGHTVKEAFDLAMAEYPACWGCMRFAGDENLKVYPPVTRSLCGLILGLGQTLSQQTRSYYIRCDLNINGLGLSFGPGTRYAFMNNSTMTANCSVAANGGNGAIRIVSEHDFGRGMRIDGEMVLGNGGQIKVHE